MVTLMAGYILFSTAPSQILLPPLSPLLTVGIPFLFIVQTLPSSLLHDPIPFLSVSSLTASFRTPLSIYGISLVPVSLPLLQTSLLLLLRLISPILLPLFLSPSPFTFSFSPSSPFLPSSFQLLSLLLLLSASPIPIFPVLASTACHTPLDTLLFLPPLFSNQSQDCGELTMAFLRLPSIFVLQ